MGSGDLATWVTGFATIALFIIGFIQIYNERKYRQKREKDFENLNKREQAQDISCWIVEDNNIELLVAVLNNSHQPIYQTVINVVVISQLGENLTNLPNSQSCISVIPPGLGYINIQAIDHHGMFTRIGIEIAFKDAVGRNWVRKANGRLVEIKKSPTGYYKIYLPTNWEALSSESPSDKTKNTK